MKRSLLLLIITFILTFTLYLHAGAGLNFSGKTKTASSTTGLRAVGKKSQTIRVSDKIRVVVADNVDVLNLSIRGRYKVTTIETDQPLKEGKTFFNIKIKPDKYGISFGKDYLKIYAIQIIPERESAIYLNRSLYRGTLQVLKTKDGLLRAINVVDLKDYLKGVLYHEVSHRWPIEAIKAQAIVSRSFALYHAQRHKDDYYYLKADTSSQVYRGVYAERYRTNKAVEETTGKVLVYRGKILSAFFHAACGGKTEDASMLWKVNIPPLKGVVCPFCKNSPHFSWRRDIELSEIEKRLKEADYKISDIDSIKIKGIDNSGRITQLILKGKNNTTRISAKDFRHIIGPALIKSTNFTVVYSPKEKDSDGAFIEDKTLHFEGKGWGHGVGMCQWGAFAMAKKGRTAEEILKYYYPGVSIVILDDENDEP